MNPEYRILIKAEIDREDKDELDNTLDILMGDDVGPGREFVEQNVAYAQNVDAQEDSIAEGGLNIKPADPEREMESTYLGYSMNVAVSRALSDIRDGLKPVHRRITYGMQQQGLSPDKRYSKSARLAGEVVGKYYPHGDSTIYGAAVRLA